MKAEHHRKQAEAYEALATLLKRVNDGQEPAPVREIAEALRPMGLCLVPRDLLVNVRECLDPEDDDRVMDSENLQAYSIALRNILHPELAEKNPTKELPL